MGSKTVSIPNISCGHCTSTIEREVGELPGVTAVKAQIEQKQVQITWDDQTLDWSTIDALLTEIGFPVG